MSPQSPPLNTRLAAVILGACAVLSILVIMHHPVVHARRPSEALAGITHLAPTDRAVHAILIGFILLMLYAFTVYAYENRGKFLFGIGALAIFALGCAGVIAAALIDGFFFPAFSATYAAVAPNLQTNAVPVLTAGAIAIQILTKFGFYAFASAALLWASELSQRGGASRFAAVVAAAAAVAEITILAATGTLDPQNLSLIALVQAVWCFTFAWRLWTLYA